jgi:hypothetical protein
MSLDWWRRRRVMRGLTNGLARGAATAAARHIDPARPNTWEFTAFSQNGEDGINDFLSHHLHQPNRYFLEIGASNGLDNNTAWFAVARRYHGLMVEARASRAARARATMKRVATGVDIVNSRVNADNAAALLAHMRTRTPDIFSLDIDGIDYHVMKSLLAAGLHPAIVVVEYNSAFGPERSVTIPHLPDFDVARAHATRLYYGVSVKAWHALLEPRGYRFLTVESNGVNAFFIEPAAFDVGFLQQLAKGMQFAENVAQLLRFQETWERQFARIADMPLIDV